MNRLDETISLSLYHCHHGVCISAITLHFNGDFFKCDATSIRSWVYFRVVHDSNKTQMEFKG